MALNHALGTAIPADHGSSLLVGIVEDTMGGISKHAESLAVAGSQAGFKVTLIASDTATRTRLQRQMGAMGIEVIDLGISQATEAQKIMRRVIPNAAGRVFSPRVWQRMRQLGKHFAIAHLNVALADTIRPFADKVVVAAWFYPHDLKARVSSQWRHTSGNPRSGYLRRAVITAKGIALYRMDERGFRASDLVIAPTKLLSDQLRNLGIRCEMCPPPVWLTPPDADDAKAGRPAAPVKATKDNSKLTLVTCAADLSNPRKNVGDLLSALGHVARTGKNVSLKALGGGSRRLEKQISMLPPNVNVELTGSLPRESVHEVVEQADLFVTSSLYEEWGYAVVESLLCGTPVIAYPVYPFSEILQDGFGTIARETSPLALAEAIVASAEREFRPDLAQAAADRFGAAAVGARLKEIWNRTDDYAATP